MTHNLWPLGTMVVGCTEKIQPLPDTYCPLYARRHRARTEVLCLQRALILPFRRASTEQLLPLHRALCVCSKMSCQTTHVREAWVWGCSSINNAMWRFAATGQDPWKDLWKISCWLELLLGRLRCGTACLHHHVHSRSDTCAAAQNEKLYSEHSQWI